MPLAPPGFRALGFRKPPEIRATGLALAGREPLVRAEAGAEAKGGHRPGARAKDGFLALSSHCRVPSLDCVQVDLNPGMLPLGDSTTGFKFKWQVNKHGVEANGRTLVWLGLVRILSFFPYPLVRNDLGMWEGISFGDLGIKDTTSGMFFFFFFGAPAENQQVYGAPRSFFPCSPDWF